MDTKYLNSDDRKSAKRALRNPHVQRVLRDYKDREIASHLMFRKLREEIRQLKKTIAKLESKV